MKVCLHIRESQELSKPGWMTGLWGLKEMLKIQSPQKSAERTVAAG